MSLIPGPCGEIALPDGCSDEAFRIADCFVQTAVTALSGFWAEGPNDCSELKAFVAFAAEGQPDDLCNQVSVLIERFTPRYTGPRNCLSRFLEVRMRFEAVFAIYPAVEDLGNGQFYVPTPDEQEAANRWLYSVGVTLFNALLSETEASTCDALVDLRTRANNWRLSDFVPVGPRGQCAGWRTTITFDLR